MHLNLAPSAGPIYRRLADAIRTEIEAGQLGPGDQLPTVRELSGELGIAGGTIRHAYDLLAREGWLDMAQGKGTFVRERMTGAPHSREAQAMDAIEHLLDELEALRFTPREMQMFFQLKLRGRDAQQLLTPVAVVECNDELLSSMAGQLGMLPGIELTEYLLSDARRTPPDAFAHYALIITTRTHYHELCSMLPGHAPRIARAVMAPSQQSTISIARIEPGARIGEHCRSGRFYELVLSAVHQCPHLRGAPVRKLDGPLGAELGGLDVLIVAPDYLSHLSEPDQIALRAFVERGGQLVPYHYQIDQGSFLHIEDRLRTILTG